MLWVERHRPKKLEEMAGNGTALEAVRSWALEWELGKRGKPLLLYGPSGVGKSAAAYALAGSLGWELVELNASDLRNRENIERVLGAASTSQGLFGRKRLILIDDVDSLAGNADRGGGGAITELLKGSMQPVLLTAGDYWNPDLTHLRSYVTPVEFRKINAKSIASVLKKILEHEKAQADEKAIQELAEHASGDLRSSINDLQAVATGRVSVREQDLAVLSNRDREKSVFDSLRDMFRSMSYAESTAVTWNLDVDPDMFQKWVDENIPLEYDRPGDLCRAFDALSRADIFRGRILARQYWGFLRYSNILATAGVALAKEAPYGKFVSYKFPHIIKELSRTRIERARLKKIGLKIAARVHVSTRDAISMYVPLLRTLAQKKAEIPAIASYFEFDSQDLAFLLGTSEKQAEKYLNKAE